MVLTMLRQFMKEKVDRIEERIRSAFGKWREQCQPSKKAINTNHKKLLGKNGDVSSIPNKKVIDQHIVKAFAMVLNRVISNRTKD